ncbi:MAG: hypothetical protein ACKV2T_23825 [Kofleriaceae bacterium]
MSKPIEDSPSLVDVLVRQHAARRAHIEAEAAVLLGADAQVDTPTTLDTPPATDVRTEASPLHTEASPARADASKPRPLVEELTRKCCERRAALDKEAHRG